MLVLLEDEKMLADSASELLSSVSPVSQQRALRDESNELKQATMRDSNNRWAGCEIPGSLPRSEPR